MRTQPENRLSQGRRRPTPSERDPKAEPAAPPSNVVPSAPPSRVQTPPHGRGSAGQAGRGANQVEDDGKKDEKKNDEKPGR